MNKETKGNIQWRLLDTVLWLPVLLIPAVYLLLLYLTDDDASEQGAWETIEFLMPFLIVFIIHDRLLLKFLFLKGRLWAYWLSVAALLTGFLILDPTPDRRNPRPRHTVNRMEERRHAPTMTAPRPPEAAPPKRESPPQHAQGDMRPKRKANGKQPHKRGDKDRRRHGAPAPLPMDFITAALLIGSNLAVVLFMRYSQERRRNTELENSKLQQELDYLKAQINPHFFMNVLNNIHGMVEIDPTKAQEMIMQLSRLMRHVLYEGSQPLTPLNQEIIFINNYVELMSRRYSKKKVDIELHLPQRATEGIMIPPLLFIVLIENAFKHGISYREQSKFYISLELQAENIVFICRNRRLTSSREQDDKGGIGLANLRKRLQLLYGNNHRLTINEEEDTYTATLIIPYNR